MEKQKPKNSASRLHSILSRLKEIPGTNPCASAFGGILEVSGSNQMLLLERVGRVTALMRRAREQTLALNAPEDYLAWFEPIQNAFFNLNLGAALEDFTRKLSPVTLRDLKFCATNLSEHLGEPELAKEEAAHVLEEIDALIKETEESQMDESARQYVLRHLVEIAKALREYEIFGREPIQEEIERTIGSIFFHQKEAQAAGERFWDIVRKVGSLVAPAAGLATIAHFMKLLPGG
jgi:hypothetical protein